MDGKTVHGLGREKLADLWQLGAEGTAPRDEERTETSSFGGPPAGEEDFFAAYVGHLGDALKDFELIEEISRGGMGVVYKAHQRSLNRTVALKVLHPAVARNPRKEAILAANLSHENIVPVHAIEPGDHPRYFVMAFVEGRSLERKVRDSGAVAPAEAVRIAMQVCDALIHAHERNIIHRDVKPGNVLLEGPSERVRVADFGIAQDVTGRLVDVTRTTTMTVGTLGFMSPEQNRGDRLDPRTDVYSLGMTLYYMLTGGKVAYVARNSAELAEAFLRHTPAPPSAEDPNVDAALDRLVMDMIATDRARRPPSCRVVRERLRRLIEAYETKIIPAAPPAPAPGRRKRVRAAAVLLAALLAAGLAAWLLVPAGGPGEGTVATMKAQALDALATAAAALEAEGLQRRVELTAIQELMKTAQGYAKRRLWRKAEQTYREAVDRAGRLRRLCQEHRTASAMRRRAEAAGQAVADYDAALHSLEAWRQAQRQREQAAEAWAGEDFLAAGRNWQTAADGLIDLLVADIDADVRRAEGELDPRTRKRMLRAVYQALRAAPDHPKGREVGKELAGTLLYTSPTTGMKFVYVPAGSFTMGSAEGDPDERPPHARTIRRGFYLGACEVTRGQFEIFVSDTGYQTTVEKPGSVLYLRRTPRDDWPAKWMTFADGTDGETGKRYNWRDPNFRQDSPRQPAVCISWDDARAFAGWLSEKDKPNQYRLPSEAQWEYACRAGTETPFSTGRTLSEAHANFFGEHPLLRTREVGSLLPNPWGLYDMHGNVWEWCRDRYALYPQSADENDEEPPGPPAASQGAAVEYVRRGGGWASGSSNCRSANRWKLPASHTKSDSGFRVTLVDRDPP